MMYKETSGSWDRTTKTCYAVLESGNSCPASWTSTGDGGGKGEVVKVSSKSDTVCYKKWQETGIAGCNENNEGRCVDQNQKEYNVCLSETH